MLVVEAQAELADDIADGLRAQGIGAYVASKAALEHMSRVLAAELQDTGIRVIVVDPGDMDTQMHRDAEPGADLSHLPKPESVAPALVTLLEDGSVRGGRFEAQSIMPAGSAR